MTTTEDLKEIAQWVCDTVNKKIPYTSNRHKYDKKEVDIYLDDVSDDESEYMLEREMRLRLSRHVIADEYKKFYKTIENLTLDIQADKKFTNDESDKISLDAELLNETIKNLRKVNFSLQNNIENFRNNPLLIERINADDKLLRYFENILSRHKSKNIDITKIFVVQLLQLMPFNFGKYTTNEWSERIVAKAIKHKMGNCTEMSALAKMLLLECSNENLEKMHLPKIDAQIKIERVIIPAHCFIIINRKQGVLSDIMSWNDDTIFVDPWKKNGFVMTKKEYLESIKSDPKNLEKLKSRFQAITIDDIKDNFIGCYGVANHPFVPHSKKWYSKSDANKPHRPSSFIANMNHEEVNKKKRDDSLDENKKFKK